MALKHGDFKCLPHTPIQSLVSVVKIQINCSLIMLTNSLFSIRIPLLASISRTTFGIIFVMRHLSTRWRSGGTRGPFFVFDEKDK